MEFLLLSVLWIILIVLATGSVFACGFFVCYLYLRLTALTPATSWSDLRFAAVWKRLRESFRYRVFLFDAATQTMTETTSVQAAAMHAIERDTDYNVIYGCHPHGILAFSWFLSFCTPPHESDLAPPQIHVHWILHELPLIKEVIRWFGCVPVSGEEIQRARARKTNASVIVPGGVREMILDSEGKCVVPVKRVGFLCIAYTAGTVAVPCYSPGESTLIPTRDWTRRFRLWMNRLIHYPFPTWWLPWFKHSDIRVYVGKPVRPSECESQEHFIRVYYENLAELQRAADKLYFPHEQPSPSSSKKTD